MKILYAVLRNDPHNPDLGSGVEYNFYSAFIREGAEVKVIGPFTQPDCLIDRILRKLYRDAFKKRYLKWSLRITRLSARALNKAEAQWRPDVVFGLLPPPLAFYHGKAPAILNMDTTLHAWHQGGTEFGKLPFKFLVWEEHRAVHNCALTITFSDWCKQELIHRHKVSDRRIFVQPMPSALPLEVIPGGAKISAKRLQTPLRLLLVGRDYTRKGIPTGIEIAKLLNARGIPAELTICGLSGEPNGAVRFTGPFRKSVPDELRQYAGLYASADILIHPATFEAAGIVPAEAAAFGVPTITNSVGGLATTVADGVSGIVLPAHSPAQVYVDAITGLVRNPAEYVRLSAGARRRYEEEQNWRVAGKRIMKALEEVVAPPELGAV